MGKVKPARWVAGQAVVGIRDLPRNGAWLLSKALKSASSSVAHDATDSLRRATIAVAERVPGGPDPVGIKLRRAESAVAQAKQAERQALAEARVADERAEAARGVAEAGKQRVREATQEGRDEVARRTRGAREHFDRLVEQVREEARQDVEERVGRLTAETNAESERAKDDAVRVAEHAQTLIDDAHEQMDEARALVADATAAAEEAAEQARAQAQAISDQAEQRAGSAHQIVEDARKTEKALKTEVASAVRAEQGQRTTERLGNHTRAELLELAQPLGIQGASRMTKDQLVRAVRSASRSQKRRS